MFDRWLISYRATEFEQDFLCPEPKIVKVTEGLAVSDVKPSEWVIHITSELNAEITIYYVEQVSIALALELISYGRAKSYYIQKMGGEY